MSNLYFTDKSLTSNNVSSLIKSQC